MSDARPPGTRSGLLVAWANAWVAGRVSYDEVIEQVTGDDEPHRVTGLPGAEEPAGVPLGWALPVLRGYNALSVVLPVPGDPRGLPPEVGLGGLALAAGEAVLAVGEADPAGAPATAPGDCLAMVPAIERHGSAIGSVTVTVHWRCMTASAPRPDPLSVPEAEHDLTTALRDAASQLADLDVATWQPWTAAALDGLRRSAPGPALPAGQDSHAVRLLAQADRLAAVLDLAAGDAPGGAAPVAEAAARSTALRPLAQAVRRARVAAYNAVPAPRR